MRIFMIEADGERSLAVECGEGKLYPINEKSVQELIENSGTPERFSVSEDRAYNRSEVKILAPVIHPAQDVICLGVNYRDHARELSNDLPEMNEDDTVYFSKRVNEAVGDRGQIPSHSDITQQLDYEAELAVILKKDAYCVREEEAGEYIFGYTIINDISARDLQSKHKQWYRGKSLDGFTAMGPCIVTADEIGSPCSLNISCRVNGELRQNSNTANMIRSVYSAIAELSCGMTLKAGTIIATGTPGGVGKSFTPPKFLKEGDVVSCSIEKIGTLTNIIGK